MQSFLVISQDIIGVYRCRASPVPSPPKKQKLPGLTPIKRSCLIDNLACSSAIEGKLYLLSGVIKKKVLTLRISSSTLQALPALDVL
jgi:hypothetical protein